MVLSDIYRDSELVVVLFDVVNIEPLLRSASGLYLLVLTCWVRLRDVITSSRQESLVPSRYR